MYILYMCKYVYTYICTLSYSTVNMGFLAYLNQGKVNYQRGSAAKYCLRAIFCTVANAVMAPINSNKQS